MNLRALSDAIPDADPQAGFKSLGDVKTLEPVGVYRKDMKAVLSVFSVATHGDGSRAKQMYEELGFNTDQHRTKNGVQHRSVQPALPQNRLFSTQVLQLRGPAFRHIGELGPNSRSFEKPFFRAFRKGITYPPPPSLRDTIFREISRHCQNLH